MRKRTGVAVLTIIAAVFGLAYVVFDAMAYKIILQKVRSPDGRDLFVLYEDSAGGGDLSFSVCRFSASARDADLKLPSGERAACEVLSNYSEGGQDTSGAKIEFVSERYLVFSRGGLYYGLYDVVSGQRVIEQVSPWHAFFESDAGRAARERKAPEDAAYREWATANIHQPIARVLAGKDAPKEPSKRAPSSGHQ